jgi:hypothetical protein
MRPITLAQAAERIAAGEPQWKALSEFLDTFYLAKTPDQHALMPCDEPAASGDARLESLLGAVAEYLAHQHRLPNVPRWAYASHRYLDRAWHASPFADDAMREYLTFASPAEFASRNIFTEERPLRRARSHLAV